VARAGLSPAIVVSAAAELSNEVGLEKLVLGQLATRLGVSMPALYKHVAGLDDLKRLIALDAARELRPTLAEAGLGLSSAEAIHAIARRYRDWARANPGRYTALQAAPSPEDSDLAEAAAGLMSVFTSSLAGFRLSDDDLIDAVRMLRSLLHGFIGLEAAGGFKLARPTEVSFARMIDAVSAQLATWSGPAPG